MLSTRICLIVAVVFGLNACSRETDDPPPVPPADVSSSDSVPVPPPATPEKTAAISSVKPSVPPPIVPAKAKEAPPKVSTAVTQPSTSRTTPKVKSPDVNTPVPASTQGPTSKTTKAATSPDAPIPLDLIALEKQLKSTKAIGIFSKIALKNQVDDLMKQFREHYKGKNSKTMSDLRQSYDLLMMKVLSLVQDNDKNLAAAIVSSRAAIWDLLADPVKFAALDA